jgi:acetate kinase
MNILVLNCGSSSLKYQLIDMDTHAVLCSGLVERIGEAMGKVSHKSFPGTDKEKAYCSDEVFADHAAGLKCVNAIITTTPETRVVSDLSDIGAIGHRVLHAGVIYREPVRIDQQVKDTVRRFFILGPLHNPPQLVGIEAAEVLYPGVAQVAVFDTAFHATIPDQAATYAIPYSYYEELGVRRYGFHGTSHWYVAKKTAQVLGKPFEKTSCITVHLGNGCSMDAVKNGQCVDTSMGLTPLQGLMMGTRSGDIDASIYAFLAKNKGMTVEQIDTMLNKQSGLKGICGLNDMRDIHAARAKGDKMAELAFKMFCYRVKQYIGSYLAVLGGCDAVVFTAGIGENDPEVRQMACDTLGAVGVKVDHERNFGFQRGQVVKISTDDSPVAVYVIPTNEELEIATQTYSLVNGK